jgi:ribose 5-phosphate isomerase B
MKVNKVFIASDHRGFNLKTQLRAAELPLDLIDLGTTSEESVPYPEFTKLLCERVLSDEDNSFGVLICGSGIGVSIAANRFKHIRAALCRSEADAKMARQHNDANVICLGANITNFEDSKAMLNVFFNTPFEGGRHENRVKMFNELGTETEN